METTERESECGKEVKNGIRGVGRTERECGKEERRKKGREGEETK